MKAIQDAALHDLWRVALWARAQRDASAPDSDEHFAYNAWYNAIREGMYRIDPRAMLVEPAPPRAPRET
jgi:hypothetical protein